jgi:hypothetical protein
MEDITDCRSPNECGHRGHLDNLEFVPIAPRVEDRLSDNRVEMMGLPHLDVLSDARTTTPEDLMAGEAARMLSVCEGPSAA